MKKLLVVFPSFCLLALGFSSCLDDEDPVYYYIDEPAMVKYEDQKPMLETAWGTYYAPYLSDTLRTDDYLWTHFIIDTRNQPDPNLFQVSDLRYKKIGMKPVRIISSDMQDEFNEPIEAAVLYKSYIDSVLFFGFEHKSLDKSAVYEYELICNTDSIVRVNGKDIPKLYLRAKKTGTSSDLRTSDVRHFGFNMAPFVKANFHEGSDVVLSIYYKTGTSAQGVDIYKSFIKNPILWKP